MASRFTRYATGNNIANGAVLVMLAAYLGAVLYRGNIKALPLQVWEDITGRANGQPAFWQWGLSLIVLYLLAKNPKTEPLFGPLLTIVFIMMLIQLATRQPQIFKTLDNNIRYLFGGPTASRS